MPLLESATTTIKTPPRRAASLPKLVLVEARKAVDTRASRALLIVIAALATVVIVGISIYSATQGGLLVAATVATGMTPATVLLPVVGILLVTAEWSQRTALVTFALVPERWRVLLAKIIAVLALSVVVLAVPVLIALLVAAVVDGNPAVEVDYSGMGAVMQSLGVSAGCGVLLGVGVAALTLSSPLSIVLVLAVPLVFDNLVSILPGGVGTYVSSSTFVTWAAGGIDFAGSVVTSLVIWYLLPIALGFVRYLRAEVG